MAVSLMFFSAGCWNSKDKDSQIPLTLKSFSRDKVIFDSGFSRRLKKAAIPYSGTGPAGEVIQIKGEKADWTFETKIDGKGHWKAVVDFSLGPDWHRPEVRLKNQPEIKARGKHRFAVGHVISIWGQSDLRYPFYKGNDKKAGEVLDEDALTHIGMNRFYEGFIEGNSPPEVFVHRVTNSNKRNMSLVALSNLLSRYRPGEKFQIATHMISGRGLLEATNETDNHWFWEHDAAIHRAHTSDGQNVGFLFMAWTSTIEPLKNMERLFGAAVFQTNNKNEKLPLPLDFPVAGSTRHIDHSLAEFYDFQKTKIAMMPAFYDENNEFLIRFYKHFSHHPAFSKPPLQMELTSVLYGEKKNGQWENQTHSSRNHPDGSPRLMQIFGLALLKHMGLWKKPWPVMDSIDWNHDKGKNTAALSWSQGELTTLRKLRDPKSPGLVANLLINGEFADKAVIENGKVLVQKNDLSPWNPATDRITLTFQLKNEDLREKYPHLDQLVGRIEDPKILALPVPRPQWQQTLSDPAQ